MKVWDHIADVVRMIGLVVYVRGFQIVITEARTLYSASDAMRFVYGENLEDLTFSRRLSGQKVPTIEVRCYDPVIGRTRWARYPVAEGTIASGVLGVDAVPRVVRADEVPPSGATPKSSIQTINVSGIQDPAVLERIARNAFEQIGRQEIEGSFVTMDPVSLTSPDGIADLLNAKAGDPVEILVAAATPTSEDGPISSIADLHAFSRARRRRYLAERGWDDRVADTFARLQEANSFQTVFRTKDARIEWNADSGLRCSISFINYIEVREGGS